MVREAASFFLVCVFSNADEKHGIAKQAPACPAMAVSKKADGGGDIKPNPIHYSTVRLQYCTVLVSSSEKQARISGKTALVLIGIEGCEIFWKAQGFCSVVRGGWRGWRPRSAL
jgi:hypothetical protein